MHPLRVNNPEAGEMIQIIAADASGNITVGGEIVMCVRVGGCVCEAGEMIQIIAADASGNITVGGETASQVCVCVYFR